MTVIFFRTIILYVIITIAIRAMGKRQIGELEPVEFVVTIMISELAALPMQDTGNSLIAGIIPIITLLCLEFIMSFIVLKSIKLRKLMQGKPNILIEDGKIIQNELIKSRLSIDELIEELRIQGYTDLNKIKYAILETSGRFSVLPYECENPVTRADMGIQANECGLPVIMISDGRILSNNLSLRNKNENNMHEILEIHGKLKINDIFLLTIDEQDNIYLAKKDVKP